MFAVLKARWSKGVVRWIGLAVPLVALGLAAALPGWETEAAWAEDSSAAQTAKPSASGAAPLAVEVGEFTATAPELSAEFQHLPPAKLVRIHDDDSAARTFALDYYGALLFSHDAKKYGLFERRPGFEQAVAAEGRRAIAFAYLRDMLANEDKPSDKEIEQFYALEKNRLCGAPARYRLARLGVVIGKNAGDAERKAADARLAEMQTRLDAGTPFGRVADEGSDLESREPGGVVGWLTEKDLQMADGREEITALAVGEQTAPISTSRGKEIYSMLEKEAARLLTLDECKAQIKDALATEFVRQVRLRRMDEIAIEIGASMNIDQVIAAARAVPRPEQP